MLSWWLGRPVEGKYCQDTNPELEVPETPAPVFAARALKSAIFGTPAAPDETIYDHDDENSIPANKLPRSQSRSSSPSKPPGILLTPGTATSRRKTVSFGNEVVENEQKYNANKINFKKGAQNGSSGKIPTQWELDVETSSITARKTTLTKTLENARESKIPKTTPGSSSNSSELQRSLKPSVGVSKERKAPNVTGKEQLFPQPPTRRSSQPAPGVTNMMSGGMSSGPVNCDATMDLNEPHSQSGRYWKSEYEQYHAAAKEQMERLINYKVLAKSFAKMKDDEAIALTQKLEEEQNKVIQMENKVSQLSARISNPSVEESSQEMIKNLARQTALALQYRTEFEEFRATMEASVRAPQGGDANRRKISSSSRADVVSHGEPRKIREDVKELENLRSEIKRLQQGLSASDAKISQLERENEKLTQDLLHADLRHTSHLEKCEKRRDSFHTQLQRKDERIQNLQRDIDSVKESARKSRLEADDLSKRRNEQVVELRKEIASLHSSEPIAQDLKNILYKQTPAHEEVVTPFQDQKDLLKNPTIVSDSIREEEIFKSTARMEKTGNASLLKPDELSLTDPFARGSSQIPVLTSVSRPSRIITSNKTAHLEPVASIRQKSAHRALSEIVNGANVDTVPPECYGPVQHTPVPTMTPSNEGYSIVSPESPDLQLPSPEPSFIHNSHRTIHERNCHTSPRPSMFNIASSPPKTAFARPRPAQLSERRSSSNLKGQPLVSTDVSRVRREMAPDRLAAAKARLEQKKRLKNSEAGKENFAV